uniref:Uncharacterized protein n=1 Tax=Dulem virus 131 TaxID=3145608 RepID=A0AAU8B7A9_9VIRU
MKRIWVLALKRPDKDEPDVLVRCASAKRGNESYKLVDLAFRLAGVDRADCPLILYTEWR